MVQRGTTRRGTQRSLGQNLGCAPGSVLLADRHRGCLPAVQHTILERRLQARGGRDPARGLRIRTATVRSALKKQAAVLASVPTALRRPLPPGAGPVALERAGEAEREDRGSWVGPKKAQRWRWQAIDPAPGAVVASGFGHRKEAVFLPWQAWREPCGLTRLYPEHWGAYPRPLDDEVPSPGKRHTQQMERTPLTWRPRIKRLVRQTSGVSTTTQRHDSVIGLVVNRYACARAV
jgi:insertion element IS1 protein InsB